jgi:hypothetical protein
MLQLKNEKTLVTKAKYCSLNYISILFFVFFISFAKTQSNFPYSWLGTYEGTMYIEDLTGIKDTITVDFDLLPKKQKNQWIYRMTYHSKKWGKMIKDYELFWNDSLKSPNLFILDEKDGIQIQELFMNGKFYSHFEVDGGHFTSVLERRGKKNLYFEIRCTERKNGLTTTSKPDPNGGKYTVNNYFLYNLQYVELKPRKVR